MNKLFIISIAFILMLSSFSTKAQYYNFQGSTSTIPDAGAAITFTTTVSDVGVMNAAAGKVPVVRIDITHAFTADLNVTLTSPEGTTIVLTSNNGGSGDNYQGTIFDIAVAGSITGATAPFAGRYLPEGLFSDFDGENGDGVWRLSVQDNTSGIVGTFNYADMWLRDHHNASYELDNGSLSAAGSHNNDLILSSTSVNWVPNIHNQANSALDFDGTFYATSTVESYPTNSKTSLVQEQQ